MLDSDEDDDDDGKDELLQNIRKVQKDLEREDEEAQSLSDQAKLGTKPSYYSSKDPNYEIKKYYLDQTLEFCKKCRK